MTATYDLITALIEFESGKLNTERTIKLFQYLIDTDLAWELQGSYGKVAKTLIESGYCKSKEENK